MKVLVEGGADINRENEVCLYVLSVLCIRNKKNFSRWD